MNRMEKYEKMAQYIDNEEFSFYYIILTMIIVPIAELITEFLGCSFESQALLISASGALGFFAFAYCILKRIKNKSIVVSDFFIILINVFMLFSLVFSKDKQESLTGIYYDELFTHFWAYYSLAFAGTRINDETLRKKYCMYFVL